MMFGESVWGGLGMLHTRKSPSAVCVASMSVFCFVEDPCQASCAMGEGALAVVRVWSMVKVGCRFAMSMHPFRYLSKQN